MTVQGEVLNRDISFGLKRILTCRLRDDSDVLTPVCPTTKGVRHATLRNAVEQALKLLDITLSGELLLPELRGG